MKNIKEKIMLWKYFFDRGFSMTNYFKYPIALFALHEAVNFNNVKLTVILGITWAVSSVLLGRAFYKYGWNTIEIEIQNKIDPFVKEVRAWKRNSTKKSRKS